MRAIAWDLILCTPPLEARGTITHYRAQCSSQATPGSQSPRSASQRASSTCLTQLLSDSAACRSHAPQQALFRPRVAHPGARFQRTSLPALAQPVLFQPVRSRDARLMWSLWFPKAGAVLMMPVMERRSVKGILIDMTSLIRICVWKGPPLGQASDKTLMAEICLLIGTDCTSPASSLLI